MVASSQSSRGATAKRRPPSQPRPPSAYPLLTQALLGQKMPLKCSLTNRGFTDLEQSYTVSQANYDDILAAQKVWLKYWSECLSSPNLLELQGRVEKLTKKRARVVGLRPPKTLEDYWYDQEVFAKRVLPDRLELVRMFHQKEFPFVPKCLSVKEVDGHTWVELENVVPQTDLISIANIYLYQKEIPANMDEDELDDSKEDRIYLKELISATEGADRKYG